MNIELLAAGTKPPAWIEDGFREYQKRLPREWQLRLREIPVARRSKNANVERLKEAEAEKILAAVNPGARVVALDSGGEIWSTEQLAMKFTKWQEQFGAIQLLIGGPDGLSDSCLSRANDVWSLSRLTFPHFLVRVLVAEQVYRAWSLANNHPYHK